MIRPLALACVLTAAAHPLAARTLCGAGEKTIFACSAGAKIVSVCAMAGDGALRYRFGPAGKPEIAYPAAGSGREVARSGLWAFSGGGGAWLAFHNPPFRYVVYTAIGRGWGEKAGVAVERDGRPLTNLPCRGRPVSELGPDFFASAGIAEDTTPFDLP